jgi:hypothetical protein
MASHSKCCISSALTAATRSAASTITIPGKKGEIYTVVAIDAQSYGTLETAKVGAGGKVELENDAGVNWKPLEFYTGYPTAVTSTSSGAIENKPTSHKVNLPLPSGSIVSCYFTPYDDQSQKFTVTVHYIKKAFSGKQTHMKTGVGSAVTAATKAADHVSITVPSEKGGHAYAIHAIPVGIFEVAGSAPYGTPGGKVEGHNPSALEAWEPTEFYTDAIEALVAGAARIDGKRTPVDLDLPASSVATFDYTPNDDLTQYLAVTILYEA